MEKFTKYVPLATLALVAVIALMLVGGNQSVSLGASGTRFPNGLSADSTSPIAGELRGTTLTTTGAATLASATVTGTLTQSTTNTATTTAALGCVQTTATSTATPIRMLFTASTTATALSGTQAGFVLWGYGSCPF